MEAHTQSAGSSVLRALRQGEFTLGPRHVGFGLHIAWIYLCFYSPVLYAPSGGGIGPTHTFYLYALTFATAVLFLTTIGASRYFPLIHKDAFLGFGVLMAFAGPLAAAVAYARAPDSLLASLVSAAMTGIGVAWLLLMWGEFYGSISVKGAGLYACLSYVLAVTVYFIVASMDARVALAATVLLPLVSGAQLFLNRKEVPENAPVSARGQRQPFPIPPKIVLGLVLYSGLWGLFRGLARPGTGLSLMDGSGVSLIGVGLVALLLAGGLLVSSRDLDLGFTYRPVLPLMAAGLVLLPLLAGDRGLLTFAVIRAGHTLFDILVWILLADISFRGRIAGARVFGWGRSITYASILAGGMVARVITPGTPLTQSQVNFLSLATVYIMLTSTMFILNERDVTRGWGLAKSSPIPSSVQEFGLGRGLTPREMEVLDLLAKGRSLPYIQRHLHIAQGTAKTHVSSIYRKVSVCDRQELLDLLEGLQTSGEETETALPGARA